MPVRPSFGNEKCRETKKKEKKEKEEERNEKDN